MPIQTAPLHRSCPPFGPVVEKGAAVVGAADLLSVVGGRIKIERLRQRMSRRLLSGACGVSERFLAQVEQGEGNISLRRLKAVADALDLSLADLLREDLNYGTGGDIRPRSR